MTHSSAQLKRMARIALGGKWGSAAIFTLFFVVLTFGLSMISLLFDSPNSLMGGMICWIANVIVSLISGLFSAGVSYYYLNICRGRKFSLGDLFAAFRMDPDRFLIVSLITGSINFLCLLPTYLWIPEDPNDLGYLMITLILLYTGTIFSLIISLFFTLSRFLLLDFPDMGAIESLRMSAYLMKGNKGRYFYIILSFLGWVFLSIFTFFIGLLWIEPYMNMTITYFYEDILTQVNKRQMAEKSAMTDM